MAMLKNLINATMTFTSLKDVPEYILEKIAGKYLLNNQEKDFSLMYHADNLIFKISEDGTIHEITKNSSVNKTVLPDVPQQDTLKKLQ